MLSNGNLLALAGLLFLFLLSIRWVFGTSKPKRVRATALVRGARRVDGTWEHVAMRAREQR